MKKLLCAVAIVGAVAPVMAADVGVSVSVSQPGVYGRIDIGNFPQPAVVVAQPVVIQQPRVVVAQPVQPVYMWVPPGHQKNWGKHCQEYNACGVPVYFVKDEWYQQNVMHGKGGDHGDHGGKGHGKGKGKHGD
ncbi:MAG TPA: hypothetical protein VGQ23_10140 [Burkholderiaceae bacterium]|jgi:hypothetical protein|nr:hypothetical protein [Burkholderiaceae bacterium]